MSSKFVAFLSLAKYGENEISCIQAVTNGKCEECEYSFLNYCNRKITDPPPMFKKKAITLDYKT